MAAEVKASGSSFEVGSVQALFDTRTVGSFYDADADGQRFVVVQPTDQPSAVLTLVVNGLGGLKK